MDKPYQIETRAPRAGTALYVFSHVSARDEDDIVTFHVHESQLDDYLDSYGCYDSVEEVVSLNIGDSIRFGFDQFADGGLIVGRLN